MKKHLVLASVAFVAACHSSTTPAPAPKMAPPPMPTEVEAFHQTLSPLWHAETGPERMNNTCGAVGTFETQAAAIGTAPAPAGVDATMWTTAASSLAADVTTLKTTCATPDQTTFTPTFEKLHTSFHNLVMLMPGAAPRDPATCNKPHANHE